MIWKQLLVTILVIVGGTVVLLGLAIEPFLDLPPFWQQLAVGIVLTLFGGLMIAVGITGNFKFWPKEWRLRRTKSRRLHYLRRLVDYVWGDDTPSETGI